MTFDPAYFAGQVIGMFFLSAVIGSAAAGIGRLLRLGPSIRCGLALVACAIVAVIGMIPRHPGFPSSVLSYPLGAFLAMLFLLWQIKPWHPDDPAK